MIRGSQYRTGVPRHRADQYARVAEGLSKSAEDLFTLAESEDRYGNAIGVLAVHAAIAWTDALTIGYRGWKHTGSDHRKAADLLLKALGSRMSSQMRKTLMAILQTKEEVSYQGQYYRVEDAMSLLTQLRKYGEWAGEQFAQRPG
jgi:hypothetical protein